MFVLVFVFLFLFVFGVLVLCRCLSSVFSVECSSFCVGVGVCRVVFVLVVCVPCCVGVCVLVDGLLVFALVF